MWIRMRPDIGWLDLLLGWIYCFRFYSRSRLVERVRHAWSPKQNDFLIALSVRSAFDLLLRAQRLPAGSEVLLSALTIPDMVRIVRAHGLVPVPVDTDQFGNIQTSSFRRAISPRSRMVVIAHLYGGIAALDEVIELARSKQLMIVEDCAQSFQKVGESGHPQSDAAMFSFGPIKTATALGGAVMRVSSTSLRNRIHAIHGQDPVQSRLAFARRLAWFSLLKFLSGKRMAWLVKCVVESAGGDFDSMVSSMARGFAHSHLLRQLRRRPCQPLLRLLQRRWQHYDFNRIERRRGLGKRIDQRIETSHADDHSYWVYPLLVDHPDAECDRLRAAGFDATCQARMEVVPAVDHLRVPVSAQRQWSNTIFLPWYPDMTEEAVDEMASIILGGRTTAAPERDAEAAAVTLDP